MSDSDRKIETQTLLAAGQEPVQGLGAFALALHLDAGGPVQKIHARRGLVDLLAARAPAADEPLDQVLFPDPQGAHALGQLTLFLRADGIHRVKDGPPKIAGAGLHSA